MDEYIEQWMDKQLSSIKIRELIIKGLSVEKMATSRSGLTRGLAEVRQWNRHN